MKITDTVFQKALYVATAAMNNPKTQQSTFVEKLSQHDYAFLLVESSLTLWYNYRNAKDAMDLIVASTTFYSMVTNKSACLSTMRVIESLVDLVKDFLPTAFQSEGKADWIDVCDKLYSNVSRVKTSVLGNKLVKVFNHLIAHTFYAKIGVELDNKIFTLLESKKIRPTRGGR